MKTSSNITVWLLEDNQSYRESMAMVLNEAAGITCEHSFTSGEAVLQMMAHREHPDILISDIGLPGISGIETIQRVRNINPEIQAIILTVHDEDEMVFNAICTGACSYLLKSATGQDLTKAIRQVYNGGSPMNAKIARKIVSHFSKISGMPVNYDLTQREKEILQYIVDGVTKKAIALELGISFHTVDTHIRHIYEKLQVHSRSEAVAKAVRENLL